MYYRVTKMSGNIYAVAFDDLEAELPNFEGLLESGDSVLIVNSLEDAADVFEVEVSDIVIVES